MKRNLSSAVTQSLSKRQRPTGAFNPNKVATQSAAAAVDDDPPLPKLLEATENSVQGKKGDAVVYWMRMGDLRSWCTYSSSLRATDDGSFRQSRIVSRVQASSQGRSPFGCPFRSQPAGLRCS